MSSIQQKLKICKRCQLPKRIFSKGLCDQCNKIENPTIIKRGNKPVNKVSVSQKERTKRYLIARKEYLDRHKLCEANIAGICTFASEDIHHKKKRIGENLFRYFLAVCRNCHKYIEENPKFAYDNNFSIPLNQKNE